MRKLLVAAWAVFSIFASLEKANSTTFNVENIANCSSLESSNYVTNGDFSDGLGGWEINNPGNQQVGVTTVDIDGLGPLKSTEAFFVKAGGGYGSNPVSVFQNIQLVSGGTYTLFANLSASYFPLDKSINNLAGGTITASFNGKTIGSCDFGEIARNTFEYATLSASFMAESSGILDFGFFRRFATDVNSPINYLDNVSLVLVKDNAAPVPEPATVLLLGIGLFGVIGYSKKDSMAFFS